MDLRSIIIVVSILWLGSEIALTRMRHSQPTDVQFDKFSTRKLWVTIFISVNLGVLVAFQHIGHFEFGSRIFPIAGIALIIFGLSVRWFAILSLKHQFTVDVAIRKNHRLIKEGIYRLVRHPSYAGFLLSSLGLGVCFPNYLTILIVFVPTCLAFLYRIHVEEKALIHAFGTEYLDYCSSTKRLIPGIF